LRYTSGTMTGDMCALDGCGCNIIFGCTYDCEHRNTKAKTPVGYNLKHSWVLVLQLASRYSASNEGEEHILRARSEQDLCLGNHASASLSSSSSVISLPAEFFSSPPTSSLETVDWSSPSSSSSTAVPVGADWPVCLETRGLRVATPFDLQSEEFKSV
jgi:hypothetical protein